MLDVRKLILESVDDLDSGAQEKILAAGASAVPALLEVLADPALAAEDGPGDGWAPVHAADLLGELRAPEATGPLLAIYESTDWDDHLKDRALQALQKIGAPVLEPALRAFEAALDEEWRDDLRALFSDLHVQDDRAFQILSHPLPLHHDVWAARLAMYGDERAVPLLLAELDRRKSLDPLDDLMDPVFLEVASAARELGGALRPAHETRIARMKELVARAKAMAVEADSPRVPATRKEKPGRNDPCWCGSTKKYKKCHLETDSGP
jgi:hypothetical protein